MKSKRKKLIRITTVDFAQSDYMKGQNRYMNQYFDVIGAASDSGKLAQVERDEGVRMVNVPMDRKINPLADIKSMRQFYKLFREVKPDIINSNSPKSSLLSMIAGWLAHVPIRIYTVTGLRYQGAHGLLRWLLINSERVACLFANHVVPESQGVLHCLKQEHITHKPLKVIWNGNINGVNTEHWSLADAAKDYGTTADKLKSDVRRKLNIEQDDIVFVFVGRIVHDKGMNELAEAMRRRWRNSCGDFMTMPASVRRWRKGAMAAPGSSISGRRQRNTTTHTTSSRKSDAIARV
jgi:glycosyltransferase involved in cell wall biosynthesis